MKAQTCQHRSLLLPHSHTRSLPFFEQQERQKPQGRAVPTSTTHTEPHCAAATSQGESRTGKRSQEGSAGHSEMLTSSFKSSTARSQTSPSGRKPGAWFAPRRDSKLTKQTGRGEPSLFPALTDFRYRLEPMPCGLKLQALPTLPG